MTTTAKTNSDRIDSPAQTVFGSLLREMRRNRGYSLIELSDKIAVSKSRLARIELGRAKPPNVDEMRYIVGALRLHEKDETRLWCAWADAVRAA